MLRYISKAPNNILYCRPCKIPLRMGNNRIWYCPKCKATLNDKPVHSILCCAECEKPLQVTENGGGYCGHCKFIPSMQDTFLWKISAMKNLA